MEGECLGGLKCPFQVYDSLWVNHAPLVFEFKKKSIKTLINPKLQEDTKEIFLRQDAMGVKSMSFSHHTS